MTDAIVLAVGQRWRWGSDPDYRYREIISVFGGIEPGVVWRSPWTHGRNYTSRRSFERWIGKSGAALSPARKEAPDA